MIPQFAPSLPIDLTWSITSLAMYYIVTLLVGLGSIILGYRLFALGIETKPSRIAAAGGTSYQLTIESAAPGTFFALFGAIIVTVGIWRGPELNHSLTNAVNTTTAVEKQRTEVAIEAFRAFKAPETTAKSGADIEKRLHEIDSMLKKIESRITDQKTSKEP